MDTVWILLCMYIVSLPPEEYEIDYRVWSLETKTTHYLSVVVLHTGVPLCTLPCPAYAK